MKRMKLSAEEEQMVLKFRWEKRIYNEGIQSVIDFIYKHKIHTEIQLNCNDWPTFIGQINLLKKEI